MSLLSFYAVVNVNLCIKDKKFYQYKNRYKNIWFRNRKIYGYGMKNKYKFIGLRPWGFTPNPENFLKKI